MGATCGLDDREIVAEKRGARERPKEGSCRDGKREDARLAEREAADVERELESSICSSGRRFRRK